MFRPLDGVTVLAFEHAVAAPVCTRHLADQGARVIKIERPGVGDFARAYDTRVGGMSSYFVWANRSKESLTLDLKRPEAREVLNRLLAKTDVVVQNLAPGAAARLGLSIDSLRPRFPRIIVCDISGYGLDGPYRDKKAYDLMVQAEAGLLAVTGTGDAMARAGFSAADTAAGMYAYSSILAALLLRARTGEGSRIDVAMLEALAEWMGNPMYYTYGGGAPAPRTGAFHPSVVPYGPFSAGDGAVVMMGLQNEREWVVFCRDVLESPELATDPRFGNNTLRTENRDALEAIILAAFARMSAAEVQQKLDRAGLATANVNTPADLWDHPQLVHRKRWVEVGSPVGPIPALLPPGSSDRYNTRMDAIPALGEQTDAILDELGFDAGEIASLHAAGAV